MFTFEERDSLRSELLERAASDPRIGGAAITGSGASGGEDRWSDIDLAFAIVDPAELAIVLSDWTGYMYARHSALDHLDVKAGAWIYRVFLLSTTLQVDLAFVAAAEFRPLAPSFRLVFGKANEERYFPPPQAGDIIGYGWLYALHARSCIARKKLWQGEYMISAIRDSALALACIRHDLPAVHGRGFDLLPAEVTLPYNDSFIRDLNSAELARAFRMATQGLLREIRSFDANLAGRLEGALTEMSETLDYIA